MARGVHSPGPEALPKVSFVKIDEDISPKAYGVDDKQQRSYGCTSHSSSIEQVTLPTTRCLEQQTR